MTQPILIMGATSGIGKCAVEEALSRDLPVRAFARSADTLSAAPNLEIASGDARNASDVAAALQGVRAVIYALGIKERLSMLWQEETLFSETTRILLDQMGKADVSRLIAVTGFGAGRSRDAMSTLERIGHTAILGRPYADKSRQETLIMQSEADWTIVRPTILTNNKKTGQYRVLRSKSEWRMGMISRCDVAAYLIDAATDDIDVKTDVVLTR
ncbi:MAG: NAD(P)-binding oxidoreductase [Sulfitobacter sp.]